MNTPQPRIIGTEMEYGYAHDDGKYYSIESKDLASTLPPGVDMIRSFLSNGGRLYVDMGHKLEYATPESLGPLGATAAEFAGESLVFSSLKKLVQRDKLSDYPFRKRVVDDDGNTWGYHENYLVSRERFTRPNYMAILSGHLATRTIFTGAGRLFLNSNNRARVIPAQKMRDIYVDAGGASTFNKALVNTRDQPLADDETWARQHVVCGDANISPLATFMKLGSTSLVLRLAEFGNADELEPLYLMNPLFSAHVVASDTSLRRAVELENGNKITALDYQQELIAHVHKLAERVELPAGELLALKLWDTALNDLGTNPNRAKQYIEWLAKTDFFIQHLERHKPDNLQERLRTLEAAWDNIDPSISIGRRWLEKQQPDDMALPLSEADIIKSQLNPPETRAKQRGRLISKFVQSRLVHIGQVAIDWDRVHLGENLFAKMDDPYAAKANA